MYALSQPHLIREQRGPALVEKYNAGTLEVDTAIASSVAVNSGGTLTGSGTINGVGNYGFLLTATDGQVSGGGGVDKFRIKIWDKNNNGAIVYDNMLGSSDDLSTALPQAIGGGSIVIQASKK